MAYSKAFYAALLCFFVFTLVISCSSNKNVPFPQQAAPKPKANPLGYANDLHGKSSSANNACPKDALKLGVCADMLGRSIGPTIGAPPKIPCCKFMGGLFDLEAAICLCTAMKANVFGTNIDIPISLSYVLNNCQKNLPSGFQCSN